MKKKKKKLKFSKYNHWIARIANQEGKKHEASMGDVKEIVGLVADLAIYDVSFLVHLLVVGVSRLKTHASPADWKR